MREERHIFRPTDGTLIQHGHDYRGAPPTVACVEGSYVVVTQVGHKYWAGRACQGYAPANVTLYRGRWEHGCYIPEEKIEHLEPGRRMKTETRRLCKEARRLHSLRPRVTGEFTDVEAEKAARAIELRDRRAEDAAKISRALAGIEAKLKGARATLEGRSVFGRSGSLSPVGDILAELQRLTAEAAEVAEPHRGDVRYIIQRPGTRGGYWGEDGWVGRDKAREYDDLQSAR
jgi:hypothetical protein